MDKLESWHKMKFSKKFTNKINQFLAIINNISESSHDSYNIDIDNNSIQNIANDSKTNNNTILQKNLCYVNNNDEDINISSNSELFDNKDHDVNELSNIMHVENSKNKISLTSKIAKWAIKENVTLSALRNLPFLHYT